MTEKEQKYRAHFRNIGKHLHKNEYMPLNLAKHPLEFRNDFFRDSKPVLVNWGWAARTDDGGAYIPFDNYTGEPKPYEGFWEARCFGCVI